MDKPDHISYFNKTRVETFSDGIFAIIVTLLVLEIKVPVIAQPGSRQELMEALLLLLPKIMSWIVSFAIVCVIWVNHHRIFEQLKWITHEIFWLNANLLLWCSFIPFPTALMGDYIENPISLFLFGLILFLLSLSFVLMRLRIIRNPFVLDENVDITTFRKATTRSIVFGPALYLIGAFASFIHPYMAFIIYTFIPGYFIFFNTAKSRIPSIPGNRME